MIQPHRPDHEPTPTDLGRRQVVAAALAAPWLAGLARAEPAFTAPIVESLAVQVIIDNAVFGPFLPNLDAPGLKVERLGGDPGPVMTRRALQAEFGLSVLASSQMAGQGRRVLVDFGYTPGALANNLSMLGIDPDTIDAAVLSHGHLDHYGGFPGLFAGAPARARRLPLYVGGEETFCERVAMIGQPPPLMGRLDKGELARAGLLTRIAPQPAVIAGQAFTSGLIPLASFERAAIPTAMRPGKGCARALLSPAKRDLDQIADDGEHELATCYNVRGLGLVVISSCSHRGVLNAVRQAQAISGVRKVHAVIGGFHLVRPRTDEEARRTAQAFVEMNPDYIIPMHCTGEVFITEALRLMPGKVIRPYVGTRFTFRA